jgi:hypothetical protein
VSLNIRIWRKADMRPTRTEWLLLTQSGHSSTFPCHVELGVVGIRGAHLTASQEDIRGPIQFDEATARFELTSADPSALNKALLEFFDEVFDKTGYARPANQNNFPPGPPQ